MRFSTTFLLASAGIAAAQTSTAAAAQPSSTCLAQPILDTCLVNTQIRVDLCQPNDWGCLCDAYTSQLTCFDNCPGDPNRSAKSQQQIANCNAAKAYPSSSSTASSTTSSAASSAASVASTASSAVAATGSASTASRTNSGSQTGSATITTGSSIASAAAATSTGAGPGVIVPAGGLLAVALGLLGML